MGSSAREEPGERNLPFTGLTKRPVDLFPPMRKILFHGAGSSRTVLAFPPATLYRYIPAARTAHVRTNGAAQRDASKHL
jgi:hypothetical protein